MIFVYVVSLRPYISILSHLPSRYRCLLTDISYNVTCLCLIVNIIAF